MWTTRSFHQAMIDWKEKCKDAEETGEEPPRITDYIGAVFSERLQMAYRTDQTLLTIHTNKK